MFPLGVLKKKNLRVLRLSLPFSTDAIDTSGNAIPTYIVGGTPTYSGGSLLLDGTDVIATGTADAQAQTPLNSAGKGWQLEFDVQMIETQNTRILTKSIYTSSVLPNIQLVQSTGKLIMRSYLNQGVFDVNVGLDMTAAFFNVKITQDSMSDYPKLYINNSFIASGLVTGNVLGNGNNQAGFVFGTGSNGAGFRLKNFKFYTT